MSQPLYRLWMARPTEAYFALSGEEQQRLIEHAGEALQQVGARSIMVCDASWSTEQWPIFGLEEYPDLESVQRHQQIITELQFGRYLESMTLLGTQFPLGGESE